MSVENFRWIAGVIAAHKNRQVVGRTRLQKEMRLLQRLGMPAEYEFRMHYYGPYSEGLQADVGVLENFGLVSEDVQVSQEGNPYSIFTADARAELDEMKVYAPAIKEMERSDATVLELAATYDAFRCLGLSHEQAIVSLRDMKGTKCEQGREDRALALLKNLGLLAD